MKLTKEVSLIFDIHCPNPKVFCKLFKDNQICISVVEYKKSHQEQNTLLFSIIIYEAL